MAVLSAASDEYHSFMTRRHRPALEQRSADRWAAFLLPHLRPEMRVLDVGCGPGAISVDLVGQVIGVDLSPVPIDGIPVAGANGAALPFHHSVFDAIYLNAVLQHVNDPGSVLREARRVAKPGAVIGVGDADWGSRLIHPHDRLLVRGQQVQEALRRTGNVRVGRELRSLLSSAGFERVEIGVVGSVAGTAETVGHMAAFERTWFEAPEVTAYVTELGVSDTHEMAEVAAAWNRWADEPAACATNLWFTALGWTPTLRPP